jgi:hypothetical protein
VQGFYEERLKGLEPSTFCMASRRSSQLSYSRRRKRSIATRFNRRVAAGRSIRTAVQAAARNRAVRGVVVSAGAAAARHLGPIAQQRYGEWRDRRVYRDRAVKLARQIGGTLSEDTIIRGEPHFVVWKDGKPVQAFPHVEDLASRPELSGFDPQLARPPRPPRKLPGRR